MKVEQISSRGFLFSFSEPYQTNCYVINGDKYLYILDTFLGPKPMDDVLSYLRQHQKTQEEIFIFNSHSDYDHVWGNCVFKKSIILSHYKCWELLISEGKQSLEKYKTHALGDVELTYPNVTFQSKLSIPDDDLEFIYTPGHTKDSASCFDHRDRIAFVGDNIENPIPYIRILDINSYIESLRQYLSFKPEIIISGHDKKYKDLKVIDDTIKYLTNFQSLKVDIGESKNRKFKILHYTNLKTYGNILNESGKTSKGKEFLNEALQVLTSLPDDLDGKNDELDALREMIKS